VAKQIVRRELKTVLTSGTIVDGALLTDDLGSHCVAIKVSPLSILSPHVLMATSMQEFAANSSSAPTFGVCVLDASTAEFSLSSFEDDTCRTQIETLIRQLKPKELIHEKGNLSVSTLRLLRSALAVDCQWTALKAGTEFLRPDATIVELKKLFKPKLVDEDGEAMEVEDEDEETEEARIPDNIRQMYGKPIAMSALGGMIW
jgi:DNA mismatch repair protein MSH6